MGHCVVIDVDGEPVRLQLATGVSLTPEEEEGMREIVRAIRKKKKRKVKIVRSKK